ncbi:hypothetical protein BO85DRAFT_458525 [Aspergillus piperis CBS 112811]|uniref:BTB domain-containing protein n=1 Tax=Aspergillus piperis CBS 112811 TaxID=1448313 RepID=A0A8G1VR41_9EURO|nr:hypothetical protein BO85DRAFT_458525 [Aspergillus piperis CBS 112811]RAH59408.1 hypothetical protein BO85DRAFT_458525 [Aspergillus piperis CBS 112811]
MADAWLRHVRYYNGILSHIITDIQIGQFLNPKYSNLSIKCGNEIFPAHQNILCPQSNRYHEVDANNYRTATVRSSLRIAIPPKNSSECSPQTWTENDEFDADTEQYSKPSRKPNTTNLQSCHAFFHAQIYAQVYSSTGEHDRGLRDLVVQLTTDNLKALRSGDDPIFCNSLLASVPNFMLDICLSTLDRCAEYQRQQARIWD